MNENWRNKVKLLRARKEWLRGFQKEINGLSYKELVGVCPRCGHEIDIITMLEDRIEIIQTEIDRLYIENSPRIGEVYPDGG